MPESATRLSRLQRVPLREAWKNESGDFTPWLAEEENLNALVNAIGLSELQLVATEHWVGDFKLDILCTDGEDRVIIENQLERTNHAHLGQIIAYAAGVGAKKVIWIAESFRPEHSAALQFLNENTTEDLAFFAVEVELWRIGDSPFAPKFEVVVQPNNWLKTGRERVRAASGTSETKQLQLKFWTRLIEYLGAHSCPLRPRMARPQHWLEFSIGKAGAMLSATANTREDRLGTELYLSNQEAKRRFSLLLAQKTPIENALGFPLDWQELPGATACRIATWLPNASLEDESRWQEYFLWLLQRLEKMDAVLRPLLKTLP
jgi:hypothetical protein